MSVPEFRRRGYITLEELKALGLVPPEERLRKGPVAILECPEEIPCNICVDACPAKAIEMDGICGIPRVRWDRCIGCATCVAMCPGLAAFVVDLSRAHEGRAYVYLPHEFLPRPQPGDVVKLLDRSGQIVGEGRVVEVREWNRTLVVKVEVPPDLAMEVRAIWVEKR